MYEPQYEGTVIRPPSEADSLILQATIGCSDNRCVFCPAYKDKTFRIRDAASVEAEMKDIARQYPDVRRIFFADGDALIIPRERLIALLEAACSHFPALTRIGMYGSIKSAATKTVHDLEELHARKLGIVYLGFETGDEDVYKMIRKYGTAAENAAACEKVKSAGIKTNATVILGLGGKALTRPHAIHTAEVLNKARPHQIAALTLMVAPGTPLAGMAERGEFLPLESWEYLEELRTIIAGLDDFRCLFFANHASNYYTVNARFPSEKEHVLRDLGLILKDRHTGRLRPEFMRGL